MLINIIYNESKEDILRVAITVTLRLDFNLSRKI